jgi:hypothetical protein
MRIVVETIQTPISCMLSFFNILTDRELRMFDYYQSLGEAYCGYIDGDFVCCWGLIPPSFISNTAYLWMWNPEPLPHPFVFMRQSQIQVRRMLDRFEIIVGETKVNNRSAVRWLKWLGAEFDQPNRFGVMKFVIRRKEQWTRAA